ncbi:ABC transporter permease [Aestuariivita boseongensis]|uniref:ABC transporter permease n=1 Tax=Aestuariivita boseongensis TaxID=1470562 RepID=UPI0006833D7A|nr:ABC transporter permease [Aestuariivita boseongensis]
MATQPPPFAPFEWMIAWRYLRARRADGGVSVMTWISLIGITLAVFALIATLAVRTGLREETLRVILGATAHLEVYYVETQTETGARDRLIRDYDAVAERIAAEPGVIHAAPVVKERLIANARQLSAPVEIYGLAPDRLATFPGIAEAERSQGDLSRLPEGVALGDQLARSLGVGVGDRVRLISPNGVRTALGTSPRVVAFEVVYVFRSGQPFIDSTRAYLPLSEAQSFLNREGGVDQIDVMVADPEGVDAVMVPILRAAGDRAVGWTWRDRSGGSLRALQLQDNALYILLFILVLIATLNIVSGLVMLVKNKGRDIGILRTIGLSQGSILRVFVLVGASVGIAGTVFGAALGALFAANIEHVYALMDQITGGSRAGLEAQGFFFPPAVLRPADLAAAVALSLGLSFIVTIFPARRAARLNPVEALRYE